MCSPMKVDVFRFTWKWIKKNHRFRSVVFFVCSRQQQSFNDLFKCMIAFMVWFRNRNRQSKCNRFSMIRSFFIVLQMLSIGKPRSITWRITAISNGKKSSQHNFQSQTNLKNNFRNKKKVFAYADFFLSQWKSKAHIFFFSLYEKK